MATEGAQQAAPDVKTTDSPAIPDIMSVVAAANGKRKAETDVDDRVAKKTTPPVGNENNNETSIPKETTEGESTPAAEGGQPKMSKNQLKKLRKNQAFEARRDERKVKRKEKRHQKQAQKREWKEAKIAEARAAGLDPAEALAPPPSRVTKILPIAFIIDCDFEEYMRDHELISLSSQLVRSYAMNRKSEYQARLYFSGFKGALKERFETRLKSQHLQWRNTTVIEGDFVEAGKVAKQEMQKVHVPADHPKHVLDTIAPVEHGNIPHMSLDEYYNKDLEEELDDANVNDSIVYLTADSPYTLDRLEAGTSYVIGGLVDRNREKGLCYKRALEHKVRHAKLPIGDFMAMQSRYVLTTNQVVEIMARWLQCGDWGMSFMEVMPKRKGGRLKGNDDEEELVFGGEDNDDAVNEEGDNDEPVVGGEEKTDDGGAADKNIDVSTTQEGAEKSTEMD